MSIKNVIKSMFVSATVLSMPVLSTSVQAGPYTIAPDANCDAYYAGQDNRIQHYSGTTDAKSTLRVICPTINQTFTGRAYLEVHGLNKSGRTPICHAIQTNQQYGNRWVSFPTLTTSNNRKFEILTTLSVRSGDAISVTCVLSPRDVIYDTLLRDM